MTDQPRFFQRNTEPTATAETKAKLPTGKIFKTVLITLAILLVATYVGLKIFAFTNRFSKDWQEILFAYSKPEIVRQIRTQYEVKEAALDKEFQTGKPDQQFLNTVKQTVDQEVQSQQTRSSFR